MKSKEEEGLKEGSMVIKQMQKKLDEEDKESQEEKKRMKAERENYLRSVKYKHF